MAGKQDRDYSSFSSAAKSRFRPVAEALGYEQVTGTLYVKRCDGWYESFGLQHSIRGNPFFYVNYGIATPGLCPVSEPTPVRNMGLLLAKRLRTDDGETFPSGTRAEIEDSASVVLEQYRVSALPWLRKLDSWDAITEKFFSGTSLDKARLGEHTSEYGDDLRATTYGYLLLKCGREDEALLWLREAERIKSMPAWITRDGRVVTEKEKYARVLKPEAYELEALENVRRTIRLIAE